MSTDAVPPVSPSVVRVCFVCLGNICRSPTAQGVMESLVEAAGLQGRVQVESAGTSAHHVGEPADPRSAAVARKRGYQLTSRSQQFEHRDWERFDVVLAMDRTNLAALQRLPGARGFSGTLARFREFDPEAGENLDTPDPYYGGPQGFDEVLDICERSCAGLLRKLSVDLGLSSLGRGPSEGGPS